MPATDLEKLIVQLSADINRYEKALARAQGQTNTRMRAIERRASQMTKRLETAYASAGKKLALVFAGITSARGAQDLIDQSIGITNALKVAGLQGEDLKKVYDSLKQSALDNGAPLQQLVGLYRRAKQAAGDLGASQEDLLQFTDGVSTALRASGQSAEQSAGALLQLGQALGNGTVQAEEYNSLLDSGQPILQATAAGLKEAGGSVSKLTKLVKNGKVSSEAFFRAFLAGAPILKDQVAGATYTISQRMQNLKTVLIDAAGRFNNSTAAADTLGKAIDDLANYIDHVDFDGLINGLRDFLGEVDDGVAKIDTLAAKIGHLAGIDNIANLVTGGKEQITYGKGTPFETTVTNTKAISDHISGAFDNGSAPQNNGPLTPEAIKQAITGGVATTPRDKRPAATSGAKVTPVSLSAFAAPSSKKSSGGGAGSHAFENETTQIKQRTQTIQALTAAQASLDPLINDYGFAVEKAGAKQELLNAAQRQGIKITPQVAATIDQLSTGYANAQAAASKLAEAQDKIRANAEEIRDLGKEALGGFISDLVHGKSAADALSDALGRIGDHLLDLALDDLFSAKGGGLGSIFGSIGKIFGFASGGIAAHGKPLPTFASGGVSRTAAIFGEAGPEAAVPLPDGRHIPVELRGAAKATGSQPVSINVNVEGANGDQHVISLVKQGVSQGLDVYNKQLTSSFGARMQKAQLRQT